MSKAKLFLQLEKELVRYKKIMSEATEIILDQDVTKYPIFVAHQQEMEIGIPLLSEKEKGKWSIHASSLEEFVSKQIIHMDKVEEFKANYKDINHSICIFVLSELGVQFIFMPK